MRWHNQLLIVMAVFGAVAATAGAAWGAAAGQQIKGKVDNGTLTITGTSRADTLSLVLAPSDPTTLDVVDGSGSVVLAFDRSTFDKIVVDAGAGDDLVRIDQADGAFTDTEATTLNGQNGDDTLLGGSFAETLIGGPGNDFADGNQGSDVAFMGSGNDTFQWDPGDGSDIVEGQKGKDTMLFNGANIAEKIDLSANGPRLRLFRDIGNITMDTDGVETVNINALGGPDTVTVNDLTGTDVDHVNANLAATGGGGDDAADSVVVDGTERRDVIRASGRAGSAIVTGLPATVTVTGAQTPDDMLTIKALGGNDNVDASGLAADAIGLTIDGGDGDDRLTGGAGDDLLIGGPGNDILDGGPGNNTLIQ